MANNKSARTHQQRKREEKATEYFIQGTIELLTFGMRNFFWFSCKNRCLNVNVFKVSWCFT